MNYNDVVKREVRIVAVLELKGVTKQFGGLTAVSEVDLKIEKNQICSLIGPNGAGKTTDRKSVV